jgi:hypothetical protein
MPNNSTLLSIVGIDLSDYASRDLTITLNPIVTGALERDVNGNLVDMTLESHRKYTAVVSCTDHEAPELTGVWRGLEVTVTLIPEQGGRADHAEHDGGLLANRSPGVAGGNGLDVNAGADLGPWPLNGSLLWLSLKIPRLVKTMHGRIMLFCRP